MSFNTTPYDLVSSQTSSTARRFISSFTVMYLRVVEMDLCPARLASTNTLMPCDESEVRKVLRPLWLLALLMPARRIAKRSAVTKCWH